jgi:hypothetical protein
MEVGQGPNWGCSAKEKKSIFSAVSIIQLSVILSVLKNFSYQSTEFVCRIVLFCMSPSIALYPVMSLDLLCLVTLYVW